MHFLYIIYMVAYFSACFALGFTVIEVFTNKENKKARLGFGMAVAYLIFYICTKHYFFGEYLKADTIWPSAVVLAFWMLCIIRLVRIFQVRNKMIDWVYEAQNWEWRREQMHKISHGEMFLKFWRPVNWFYKKLTTSN